MTMVGRDYKREADDYDGVSKVGEWLQAFFACLLLVIVLCGSWVVGDELEQCRIAQAPAEQFGTGR